jgi:hypothetical protein
VKGSGGWVLEGGPPPPPPPFTNPLTQGNPHPLGGNPRLSRLPRSYYLIPTLPTNNFFLINYLFIYLKLLLFFLLFRWVLHTPYVHSIIHTYIYIIYLEEEEEAIIGSLGIIYHTTGQLIISQKICQLLLFIFWRLWCVIIILMNVKRIPHPQSPSSSAKLWHT